MTNVCAIIGGTSSWHLIDYTMSCLPTSPPPQKKVKMKMGHALIVYQSCCWETIMPTPYSPLLKRERTCNQLLGEEDTKSFSEVVKMS